jgi:tetratricopeptide (TPR) repeat protein
MASRFIGVVAVVAFVAAIATAAPAHAGNVEKARALNDKATTAFALGRYGVAADYFEQAFELKSDPALLYNAAQAHRLAGNKERALALYQNYLRVYGKVAGDKRAEIEARIRELRQAIEHDNAVAKSPPPVSEPPAVAPPPTPSPAPPPATAPPPVEPLAAPAAAAPRAALTASTPAAATAPILVARPAPTADSQPSLLKRPWFWIVTGSVAAAAAAVLVLELGRSNAATPSIGTVKAN